MRSWPSLEQFGFEHEIKTRRWRQGVGDTALPFFNSEHIRAFVHIKPLDLLVTVKLHFRFSRIRSLPIVWL
jgi:hypothetical protein